MAGHSVLAPSAAHRWLVCTPSARLEEGIESSSRYADEGTLAHSLGELMLNNPGKLPMKAFNAIKRNELYSPEMPGEVQKYVEYVRDKVRPDSVLIVEQKLDLSFLAPGQGGTADSIVITGDTLHITDLKYGRGVRVDATNNPQQLLYAAGALFAYDMIYDISQVVICIHQPRLNWVSEWTISADGLKAWIADIAIPAAVKAYAGEGEYLAGDHCKFCKVKAKCRALAEYATSIVEHDFKPAALLTAEEVGVLLKCIPVMTDWASSVSEYARTQLIEGNPIPGFKLVEGRSVRRIIDPDGLKQALLDQGYPEPYFLESKLRGITELEKNIGKATFSPIGEPYIDKTRGAPTIAPDTDPRPEYSEGLFTDTTDNGIL